MHDNHDPPPTNEAEQLEELLRVQRRIDINVLIIGIVFLSWTAIKLVVWLRVFLYGSAAF